MEILSLKFTQKDIFSSGRCSEYGVVVGRISANEGYGIPNARVSIFIPEDDLDEDDPVIHALYPYKTVTDRNEDNYRYNLLPSRQQHGGHNPTGTFFDQKDILTREEVLEVFEKYYTYTVKTNNAGDFMIWGVPIGQQTIHIDIDLSDIGCYSLRPNDFLNKGYGVDQFESFFKFKSSSDIDSLPQIVSFDKTIEVFPFWGNEELCEIGITRTDFDLSERNIKIEPVAIILLSSITDDNSHSIKKNGVIRRNSGYKCNLQTSEGKIECVRFTGKSVLGSDGVTEYPELEYYNPNETINEDGVAMIAFPMNIDYIFTNELGEQEVTNEHNKGIPTSAIARFRFSLEFQSNKIATAKYLVPNLREFNPNIYGSYGGASDQPLRYGLEYSEGMLTTYQFSDVFEDYIRITPPSDQVEFSSLYYGEDAKEYKKNLILNGVSPQDYFYRFVYGKVYTVSSFQGTHVESPSSKLIGVIGNILTGGPLGGAIARKLSQVRDSFLGIKEIRPNIESDCASSTNYFPTNFAFKNRVKFNIILSHVLLFLQYIFTVVLIRGVEIIGHIIFEIGRDLQGIKILRRIGQKFEDFTYRLQERFVKELPLTIYPDCDECTSDDESYTTAGINIDDYCRCCEIALHIGVIDPYGIGPMYVRLWIDDSESGGGGLFSGNYTYSTAPGSSLLNFMYPGESARESDDNCEDVPPISYNTLDTLHLPTNILPNGTPRFVAEVFFSGTTQGFDSFTQFIQDVPDYSFYFQRNGTRYEMFISFNLWLELTGVNLRVPEELSLIYDEANPNKMVVMRLYDTYINDESDSTSELPVIETGCEKYDKLYNESITRSYIWSRTPSFDYNRRTPLDPQIGEYIDDPNFAELEINERRATHPYLMCSTIGSGSTKRMPREVDFYRRGLFRRGIGLKRYDRKTKSGLSEFRDGLFTIIPVINGKSYSLKALQEWYRRKRIGISFCGGIVNYSFIDNWLHGILYFFKFDKRIRWDTEDNYDLNQRGSKFPKELIFFNILDKNFYYRCTPVHYLNYQYTGQSYNGNIEILHPTTFYDLGIRDEFLGDICTDLRTDPSCSVVRDITNTSYQDPANIVEYAINYRLDTTNSKFQVDDFFSKSLLGTNTKVFDGDITQLISINCEVGIEAFDIDGPHYYMYNGELMDPEDEYFDDYFKFANLYGPTPIDLKLDNNGAYMRLCLNYRLGDYTQEVPFYLWEKEGFGFGRFGSRSDDQGWDKTKIVSMPLQRIFSVSGVTETKIFDPVYNRMGRTNYLMADGEEEYILKPMTMSHRTFSFNGDTEDSLERFDVITIEPYAPDDYPNATRFVEGDLWLQVIPDSRGTDDERVYFKDPWMGYIFVVVNKVWVRQPDLYVSSTMPEDERLALDYNVREAFVPQTLNNYWGELGNAKQVLSTPFLFYFGLKPGRTSLDLLIKYYGPKDIFNLGEDEECAVSDIRIPSVTVFPTVTPTILVTPTVTAPGPVTPTPENLYFYRLRKCIEGFSQTSRNYYGKSATGRHLYRGDGVWAGEECDINVAYEVLDETLNESELINAGCTNVGSVIYSIYGGCRDCDGLPIEPPLPLPVWTRVYLVRNDSDLANPATSTCGKHVNMAERREVGYIETDEVIPFPEQNGLGQYIVYKDQSWQQHFTPAGLQWGIQFDNSSPIVSHTVYIGMYQPGQITDWSTCVTVDDGYILQSQTYTNSSSSWGGVDITIYFNSDHPRISFLYNNITSQNTINYMLKAGYEENLQSNYSLDRLVILGNQFIWQGAGDSSVITHGVFVGHENNAIIKYNYLHHVPMGIIRKSFTNMLDTEGVISYNILNSFTVGGNVKGVSGTRWYNNTFYQDRLAGTGAGRTWRPVLYIYDNRDRESQGIISVARRTKVKNNIFYNRYREVPMIGFDQADNLTDFECDYNIYWCEDGDHTPIFRVGSTTYTWDRWRNELGYDQNSVVMNPTFNHMNNMTGFVPGSKAIIQRGVNLGAEFREGLQTTATWVVGSRPALRNQSGTWQIGARIFE